MSEQDIIDNYNNRFERAGYADAIKAISAFVPVNYGNLDAYDKACKATAERFSQGLNTVITDAYRVAGR